MLFQFIVLTLGQLNSLRLFQLIYYVWAQPYLLMSVNLKRLPVPWYDSGIQHIFIHPVQYNLIYCHTNQLLGYSHLFAIALYSILN